MKQQHSYNKNGFTLVELLATMTIVVILATLAVPSFMSYLRNHEAKRTIQGVRSVFVEARAVALTRRQYVVVCPTVDKVTCDKASSSIISFIDTNANLKREPTEPVLSYLPSGLRFGELRFNVGLGRSHIRYFPDTGKPRGYFSNVTYCPSNDDMSLAKAIVLNEHGRARISFDKNGDGVDEKGGGKPLSC